MFAYFWEIFICFLESLLYAYLFYKRIGPKPYREKRAIASIFVMGGATSGLTFLPISLYPKMAIMLLVFAGTALWAFDCNKRKERHKALFWASCILVVVTIADYVAYTLALMILGDQMPMLEQVGSVRMQFTLVYVLLIAICIWVFTHLGEKDSEIPAPVALIWFAFLGIGIFVVEFMIDITLILHGNPSTVARAHTVTALGYCMIIMLFVLLALFEYFGIVLHRNRELEQQRQLALIEEQQYQFMLSTAESLSEWKHDYQGQLRLISALIEEENFEELKQFIQAVDAELRTSAKLIFTGNRTIDAVISLRIMDAKRNRIPFETKLYLPEDLPLNAAAFSSLLGNILDNALEASMKIDADSRKVFFEMKPFKRMLYIFCSNTSDGQYLKGEQERLLSTKTSRGHGIGIRRIREIVEEAGGTCQFTPQEHEFSVSVMIPLKERVS